jgi:hypothetical protein
VERFSLPAGVHIPDSTTARHAFFVFGMAFILHTPNADAPHRAEVRH